MIRTPEAEEYSSRIRKATHYKLGVDTCDDDDHHAIPITEESANLYMKLIALAEDA